jgi:hypothetical protein
MMNRTDLGIQQGTYTAIDARAIGIRDVLLEHCLQTSDLSASDSTLEPKATLHARVALITQIDSVSNGKV